MKIADAPSLPLYIYIYIYIYICHVAATTGIAASGKKFASDDGHKSPYRQCDIILLGRRGIELSFVDSERVRNNRNIQITTKRPPTKYLSCSPKLAHWHVASSTHFTYLYQWWNAMEKQGTSKCINIVYRRA